MNTEHSDPLIRRHPEDLAGVRRRGTALCGHAFGAMRKLGAQVVTLGTGGDGFHAPARALNEALGCTALPVAVYYREL